MGGVRLISSARTMLAKIGPLTKRNSRRPGLGFVEDRRAGDVRRHQVGRELDALEGDVEDLADRADHERLGQARHADEQAVAAREDGGEDLLDDLGLADDDAAELLDHLRAGLAELGQVFADPIGGHGTLPSNFGDGKFPYCTGRWKPCERCNRSGKL